MNDKTDQNGIAFVPVDDVMVGFFSEMKVRSDGVFEEVDDEVSHQHQERPALAAQL